MVVVGFTVPTLMNPEDSNQKSEQRLCKTDADCYLMCEDKPLPVLCSQNLCWQNGCAESSIYPYSENTTSFSLKIKINKELINLENRTQAQDIFVKFNGDVVVTHSGLSLRYVLEKIGMALTPQCLTADQAYCSNDNQKLEFWVNEKLSYIYENYVPQEGDKIEISFG
jgi:predicted TIM-barrel fold metal-dependent hydrolase